MKTFVVWLILGVGGYFAYQKYGAALMQYLSPKPASQTIVQNAPPAATTGDNSDFHPGAMNSRDTNQHSLDDIVNNH